MSDEAATWVQALTARGVTLAAHNGRLRMSASAYKALTDAEVLTLRHRRREIVALVAAGVAVFVPQVGEPEPQVAPVEKPTPCPYCYQAPCIGSTHHAFRVLHWDDPEERERRRKQATEVMLRTMAHGGGLTKW
jgi:antitoxin (DNA-binding transcriptional repressor) of toxin-antitoxin stability system